jgi:hypothetical protein
VRRRRADVDRRTFLRLAAAGLSSAFLPLGQLGCAQMHLAAARRERRLPTPDVPYTPVEDWYYVSIVDAYHADLDRYRLKIGGIVDNGLSLSVPCAPHELRERRRSPSRSRASAIRPRAASSARASSAGCA